MREGLQAHARRPRALEITTTLRITLADSLSLPERSELNSIERRGLARTINLMLNALPTDAGVRQFLLMEALGFVRAARALPGVRRIALIGSLLTEKADPKDIDLLVSVDEGADLKPLAAACRRLMGRAQSRNKGADVFLADEASTYIGRTCPWRECRPGIRMACDARHCGLREHLHDDLDAICLPGELVKDPPLELWPRVIRRVSVPTDVELHLVQHLPVLAATSREGA